MRLHENHSKKRVGVAGKRARAATFITFIGILVKGDASQLELSVNHSIGDIMEYLGEIISFLAGAGISWAISFNLYSFKLKQINMNQSSPTQSGNTVNNGSIVGRDQTNSH
ncbi:hypothetical protein ACVQK1_01645 [Edwardsiella tarda]